MFRASVVNTLLKIKKGDLKMVSEASVILECGCQSQLARSHGSKIS